MQATEKLSNVSSATFVLGSGWSVAGQSERDGSILYFGPAQMNCAQGTSVPSLTVYTLVRAVSYDRGTESLVVNPLHSYTALRNATLAQGGKTALQLQPGGALYTPQLPTDTGTALDMVFNISLVAPARTTTTVVNAATPSRPAGVPVAFELQVRSPHRAAAALSDDIVATDVLLYHLVLVLTCSPG